MAPAAALHSRRTPVRDRGERPDPGRRMPVLILTQLDER